MRKTKPTLKDMTNAMPTCKRIIAEQAVIRDSGGCNKVAGTMITSKSSTAKPMRLVKNLDVEMTSLTAGRSGLAMVLPAC